jgi:hypothetical protein
MNDYVDDQVYDEKEIALVLVPVPVAQGEAAGLVDKLNRSGYEAVQFKGIEDVLKALGMEPAEVDDVDTSMYDEWEKLLRPYLKSLHTDYKSTQLRLLAIIGLALTDLAKTHKRAMPPLL